MSADDFNKQLESTAKRVDKILAELIGRQSNLNADLRKAVEYTLLSPGKRIRGSIVLWSCELVSGRINSAAETAAAAVEMVHTYSLIHDDLPAMDDDDMRRGRASCHKAFDEATAILTGDALLTLAFEVIAKEIDDAEIARMLTAQLAESAGGSGMVAGQMADLKAENAVGSVELLEYIHTNKTAKMFQCSALCGAMAGRAKQDELRSLWNYGLNVGLAFQIADDILDVCGSAENLGKTVGKDADAAKCTYPAVVGMEKSRELEQQFAQRAVDALEPFAPRADILRRLPVALLNRGK